MALVNPIKYTSRTFESILSDINSDTELVDKPNWWKRGIAGTGDVASMWNNALANNLLLRTAYTRRNVQLLLELIDYQLAAHTTSSGTLIFYLKGSVSFPHTITKDDLAALSKGSVSVSAKRFEARSSVNVTNVNESFTATEVNTTTDEITVSREYMTGEKVRFTTTGGLPAPLAAATDYYVIKVDATTIQLATSLVNAIAGTQIDLTTGGSGTHTVTLYSVQVTVYQQETKDQFIIGESDGATEFQEFDLPDALILEDTLSIEINSLAWTKVDTATLVNASGTDRYYRLFYNEDGSAKIQFGDGTYGMIPPAFDIYAEYAYGGGSDTNFSASNSINVYAGSDSNVEGVANTTALTNGGDAQTKENAKILGPLLLKARSRYVTSDDGQALASDYVGVSQVKTIKNEYGVLSSKVVCIADGGGNPSAAVKTALQTYLIDATILESIDVRVEDTTITSIAVTSAAKVLSGYTWTGQVEDRYRLGWKLLLNEAGKEIYDDYIENGVDSARTLLNTILSESFTDDENDQIIEFLENLDYALIGEDRQESDIKGFLDSHVIGLDYLTVTLPAFPISVVDDEITTNGVLTLSEIP